MKSIRLLRLFAPLSFLVVVALLGRMVSAETTANLLTVGALCDYTTIQEAVDAAASTGDTIMVEAGTITGADAVFTVKDKSITIIGGATECRTPGIGKTTLDGENAHGRIATLLDATNTHLVTLENLVVTGGNISMFSGGGVLATDNYLLRLVNVDVLRNSAPAGGGIAIFGSAATVYERTNLSLINSTIEDNYATSSGGGIYCSTSSVTISDSAIGSDVGNTAESLGGGIHADSCLVTLMDDVTIDNNNASRGGGIFATDGSQVVSTGSGVKIRDNLAKTDGGGLAIQDYSTFVSLGSLIENNWAEGDGGGLIATSYTTLTLTNTEVVSNRAVNGAGLKVESFSTVTVTGQSAISANRTITMAGQTYDGGGIHVTGISEVVIADQARIMLNEARDGGGLHASMSAKVVVIDSAEIISNSAESGGGIWIGNADLNISGKQLARPRLAGNHSNGSGGAVRANTHSNVHINMSDFISNTADGGVGSGVYATLSALVITNSLFAKNSGSTVYASNSDVDINADYAASGQSDGCDPDILSTGRYCSHFDQNIGSAISINGVSHLAVRNTAFTRNNGTHPNASATIVLFDKNTSALLDTVLMAHNDDHIGIRIRGFEGADPPEATVLNSTFYSNSGTALQTTQFADLTMSRNVIWGNGLGTRIDPGIAFSSDCNLFQPVFANSLSFTGIGDVSADPLIVGDGYLLPGSPAIDACEGGGAFDITGRARSIEGNWQEDVGEFDMGAFEFDPTMVPTSVDVRGISAESITTNQYATAVGLLLVTIVTWGVCRGRDYSSRLRPDG